MITRVRKYCSQSSSLYRLYSIKKVHRNILPHKIINNNNNNNNNDDNDNNNCNDYMLINILLLITSSVQSKCAKPK